MPYISQKRRQLFDTPVTGLINHLRRNGAVKGDINYVLCRLILGALRPETGWTYASLSNALSVTDDVNKELRRRLLDPYEDDAIDKNGDVPEIEREEYCYRRGDV